ncbi:MAG: hypothetical protein GY785_06680 [Gammaproteobacteria bacterium]|nr:hypothetical protein [Gammaproteobacteria bacterium]
MKWLRNRNWHMLRSCSLITTTLMGILFVAGCGDRGGGGQRVVIVDNPPVELSGILSENNIPVDGALVTPYAQDNPDVPMFTPRDTDASGAYTINAHKDTPVSLTFFKIHLATLHTQYKAFSENTAGLDFETVSVSDAKIVIDTAFGGMTWDLADKAWLAIDVADSMGVNIAGVTITPAPVTDGGGALKCDGTLSGASMTIACMPVRSGPMYFAYYDTDAEISITVTGSSAISAPVRVGELTVIDVEKAK